MIETIQKIFKNDIMYYVIVPLAVSLLEWIKNGHDIRMKNKELGFWMKKYKIVTTFIDAVMKMYKRLTIIFVLSFIINKCISIWFGTFISHIVVNILYFSIGSIFVFMTWKESTIKAEFLTNGKQKKILILALYFIFGFICLIDVLEKYTFVWEGVFFIMLIVWLIFLVKYSDKAFVLEKPYADIYVKGSEMAEFTEARSITKQGEWIIARRYLHGFEEEIRIKESDIVRIDYYGEPLILVQKSKIFKRG